jgi:hypothetical protein
MARRVKNGEKPGCGAVTLSDQVDSALDRDRTSVFLALFGKVEDDFPVSLTRRPLDTVAGSLIIIPG